MIVLDGRSLTIDQLVRVARFGEKVEIASGNRILVEKGADVVGRFIREGRVVYGITTGFGNFADVVIPAENVRELQKNLLMSHASGTGPFISDEQVRGMMVLQLNGLIQGHSGVRWRTVERILEFLNEDILPLVPQKGSVGASGDLVPLAHLSLPLIGLGRVRNDNKIWETADLLSELEMAPLQLEAKEGLALINGTQMMTALGALNLYDGLVLSRTADVAAACSIEALRGTDTPFDPRVHRLRPHPGQALVAANLIRLLAGSEILESHRDCSKVQDAYSLRCVPQVHGAVRDSMGFCREVVLREMNSVTDNPILFPESEESLSAGNFHGEPLALCLDFFGIAAAELANISERRIERLVDPALSNLPPFLTPEGGLNSGYMITQYTAAALVSENKVLAHPASVDSIPTSANQEDHVSMGSISAFKAAEIVKNVRSVLAIELLCAIQGLDFIREKPGRGVAVAHQLVRETIPSLTRDRVMSHDVKTMEEILASETLLQRIESRIGELN